VYDNAAWLVVADNQVLSIDSANGRVGVGTSSPSKKLHVKGDNEGIRIEDGGAADHYDIYRNDTTGFLEFTGSQTSFSGYDFEVNNGSNVMRITNSGNVGIGDTTPSYKLDVNGQAKVGAGDSITPDASGNGHLMVAGAGYSGFVSLDNTAMWVGQNSGSRKLYLATDETARVTVDGAGNVGINDTTPSYKLDVNGDINATGDVRVAGNPVGLVLVKSQDIGSAVSSVTVTGAFSSSYDNYRVVLVLQDSSNNTAVNWTSPQETGSEYNYAGYYLNLYTPPTGASYLGAAGTTFIQMGFTTANSTGDGGAMTMDIFGPHRSDQQTKCMSTSTTYLVHNIWGRIYTYTSLSDITFSPSAGNFNGGKILIYGYAQ